jgi:hypothetical protein
VLIILHLFCLGIGLATNVAGGKSLLAPALFRIPGVQDYLRLLWMNFGYDFDLSSPLPEDGTHVLQVSVGADAVEPELSNLPAELPSADIQPNIRWRRYQLLAYHVAFFDELYAEIADTRTALPLAIAGRWLRDLGAPPQPYVLTCRREPSVRLPKAVERAPSVRPREGGPKTSGPAVFTTETITIHLVWDPETASYQASRAEPTGQTSEVVPDAALTGATSGAPIETGGAAASAARGATDEAAAPPVETPNAAAINPADAN